MKDLLKRHAVELLLALLFFAAAAYFYNGANWNHVSRFDVTFCFVEPGPDQFSFRINRFVWNPQQGDNTGDWARNPRHDQNYYSNKAPGPALLAIPVYAAIYGVERLLGKDPTQPALTYFNCYLINLFVTVVPAAISLVFMFQLLLRRFDNQRLWPALLCITLYFGTLVWPYSTQFWGHVTAMAFLVIGLHQFHTRTTRGYLAAGLFLGLAVLSEYSAAIPLLALLTTMVIRIARTRIRRDPLPLRPLALLCAGGAAPLLLFMFYHYVCFGNPFTIATFHNNEQFKDKDALGGLFQLKDALSVLWHLTFSSYRGLFFHMPVMLSAFTGIFAGRKAWKQPLFRLALFSVLAFLAMNLTFNGWHGGACIGPRYQICVFPFYVILAAFGIRSLQQYLAGTSFARPLTILFLVLLAGSISNMLITVAVSPTAPAIQPYHNFQEREFWSKPLFYYYGAFRRGRLRPFPYRPIRPVPETPEVRQRRIFNLGERLGLQGNRVVIPIVLLLAAGFSGAGWLLTRPDSNPKNPGKHPPQSTLPPESAPDTSSATTP